MKELRDIIITDKNIAGGSPVFKGTRVAVKTLFDYLEEGSVDEFLQGFPSVTKEQAQAVIEMAAENFLAGIEK